MTDRELMQQALEALLWEYGWGDPKKPQLAAITALRERLAQPEQESVKFCTYPKCQTTAGCARVCARQNTTPQPRQWVGLTDADMEALFLNEDGVRFARYIESRLKDKNA